jgi:hypothetical protein
VLFSRSKYACQALFAERSRRSWTAVLIGGSKNWLMAKVFAGGGSVLLLGLASLYYVDITVPASGILKAAVVAKTSLLFFGFSVISGAGCVALEEE